MERPRTLKLAVPVAPPPMLRVEVSSSGAWLGMLPPLKLKVALVRARLPATARVPPFWLRTWLPPEMVRDWPASTLNSPWLVYTPPVLLKSAGALTLKVP